MAVVTANIVEDGVRRQAREDGRCPKRRHRSHGNARTPSARTGGGSSASIVGTGSNGLEARANVAELVMLDLVQRRRTSGWHRRQRFHWRYCF